MSAAEHEALVRRAFDAWNTGHLAAVDALYAPDFTVHDPGTPGRMGGPAGEQQAIALYRAVFPDLRFDVEDVIVEGTTAATRWTARGTHRGELMGIAPTGKLVTITGMTLFRLAGGKIAEYWTNWDTLGLLQQLGALPAPGPAPTSR